MHSTEPLPKLNAKIFGGLALFILFLIFVPQLFVTPQPQIKLLSPSNTQSNEINYELKVKATDADEVFSVKTEAFTTITEEPLSCNEGICTKEIKLNETSNEITIIARNKKHEIEQTYTIIREKTESEEKELEILREKARKAAEEARKAIEAKEEAWNQSKAGKICANNEIWTKEECNRVANNKIWIGMELDMIKEQRGLPNTVNQSNYGSGERYQWCWRNYTPRCFYGGEDGIIESYN